MMRIVTLILTCLYALGIALPVIGHAAEAAIVEVVQPAKKEYWVGQRIDFAIELLVIGQFSGTSQFDLPKLPGVILMKMGDRPTVSSREMDGQSYVVQRHEFALFLQREGAVGIPAFTVRFGSKEGFDKPVTEHRLTTKPLEINVKLPEGAAPGAPIISTKELNADEQWKPKPGQAKVGDALTRTITMRASDVPGMLLPELPHKEIDGLTLYPKQPQVRDNTERGAFTGERIESVTYVCSKPGDYTIPELVIRWWNVNQMAWKEERFPSIDLKVMPNQALADRGLSEDAAESEGPTKRSMLAYLLVAGLLVAGVTIAVPWFMKTFRARRERSLQSEAGLFAQLVKACRDGEPRIADRAIAYWLEAWGVSREEFYIMGSADKVLTNELQRLQKALIGHDLPWNGRELARSLRHFRKTRLGTSVRSSKTLQLPALNPPRDASSKTMGKWGAAMRGAS